MSTLQDAVKKLQERLATRDEIENEIEALRKVVGGGTTTRKAGKKSTKRSSKKSTSKTSKKGSKKTSPKKTGRKGRAPKGSLSCPSAIEKVLKSNSKGLTLKDLTTAVLKAGYKTDSKQPAQVVYQSAYKLVTDSKVTLQDHIYRWAA